MEIRLKIITNTCLLLTFIAGCQQPVSTMSAPKTEMTGRLEAALAMENDTARHNALAQVAQDAVEAGDGDVVLKAIAAIDDGTAHDNLRSTCSEALAKKGKISDATAVAKQLANDAARNNLLGRIANGDKKQHDGMAR